MLPNTLLIGAQKSGTTYLANLLAQHPDVCFSKTKELHFFERKHRRRKGLGFYERSFEPYNDQKIVMEATPGYMIFDYALSDIHKTLGSDIKILVILRDPVNRLISQYRMRASVGGERRSLDEAVSQQLDAGFDGFKNYVNRGLYYDQLQMVRKYFPRENIHISVFEDFISDPEAGIKDVCRFLGIDESHAFDYDTKRNPGRNAKANFWGELFYLVPRKLKYKFLNSMTPDKKKKFFAFISSKKKKLEPTELSENTMKRLQELYRPQKKMLEEEYGLDLASWTSL